MRYENHTKAYQYYKLALQYAPDQIADVKRECCESLSDICFKRGDLSQCIEYGVKGYAQKPVKNEVRFIWLVSGFSHLKFTTTSFYERPLD